MGPNQPLGGGIAATCVGLSGTEKLPACACAVKAALDNWLRQPKGTAKGGTTNVGAELLTTGAGSGLESACCHPHGLFTVAAICGVLKGTEPMPGQAIATGGAPESGWKQFNGLYAICFVLNGTKV